MVADGVWTTPRPAWAPATAGISCVGIQILLG
jgi:hypothetical protein